MSGIDAGYSMPVDGPLYPRLPWFLNGSSAIVARYEADTDKVRSLLPPEVSPLEDPVQCMAWGVQYPHSTLGPYIENLMFVRVAIAGDPYLYCPLIYVDSDAPMAAGREVLGFPKKIAAMRFDRPANGPQMFTVERPAGRRLLTMTFAPEKPGDLIELDLHPFTALRVIPSSTEADRASISELLRIQADLQLHTRPDGKPDVWQGRCDLTINAASQVDPLHLMTPTRILAGIQLTYDAILHPAIRLHDYLHPAEAAAASVTQSSPSVTVAQS